MNKFLRILNNNNTNCIHNLYTIYTDSSDIGWGVVFENKRIRGPWEEAEVTSLHINIRKMFAVYFAISSFREMFRGKHIKVHSDNTTTVQVINKMGSTHSIECNSTAQLIWQFCRKHEIWLICAFLPGCQNKGADFESRKNTGMQNGCSADKFSLMQSITSTLFQALIVLLLELIVSFQDIFHINLTLLQHMWMLSLLTGINLSLIFSLPLI